jgi:hypothetical protein
MGARNRVGIGLLNWPARLYSAQSCGIGFFESILGLLLKLKIRALVFKTVQEHLNNIWGLGTE